MRVITDGTRRVDIRTPRATPTDLPTLERTALTLLAALGPAAGQTEPPAQDDAEDAAFGYSIGSDTQLAEQDDDVDASSR